MKLVSTLILLKKFVSTSSGLLPDPNEWKEWLGYGAEIYRKVVSSMGGLHHPMTRKFSLSTQQEMGTFFESGKDKAEKGEGLAPLFICCAQDTVGL